MEGGLISDWKGTEIIYVEGEGYKVVLDLGSFSYVLDLPDDMTLSDISNYEDMRDEPKITDQLEGVGRRAMGVKELSIEEFDAGFLNSDKLVSVPLGIFSVEGDIYQIGTNFLEAVDAAKQETTNKLFHDPEYIQELGSYYIQADGDMSKAITAFKATATYGDILTRLQLTQAQVDAFKMEDTNPEQFRKNYALYKTIFNRNAVKSYGSELPPKVLDYLADKTRRGYFTEGEANQQIQGIFDPYSKIPLDKNIIALLDGVDIQYTTDKEADVKELLNTYLPDHLHSEYDIAEVAGKMRNNSLYKDTFVKNLKKKRYQFYNMYDEDIAWSTIVNSKQALAESILGQSLDSSNPLLDKIIRMNDLGKEQEELRSYGLDTGNQKVKTAMTKAMLETFGFGVVPSRSYVG